MAKLKLVPFLNGPLIDRTKLGFFECFGKEQPSVTASRGVRQLSQLDHEAQCPTLLDLRVLNALTVIVTDCFDICSYPP